MARPTNSNAASERARTRRAQASLWRREVRRRRFPRLEGEIRTDVVVVGAGITGLTTALRLTEAGRRVVIVEAERFGAGTSGATSAHVTVVPDLGYARLESRFRDGARTFVTAYRQAASWIRERATRIACDYATVPGYRYAESEDDLERLEREGESARRLGVDARLERDVPLPYPVAGALLYPNQAQFHPVRYLLGLVRRVTEAGGVLYEGSRVLSWDEREAGVTVELEGARIRAEAVVFATHTPVGFSLVQTELGPYRSYLLALRARGDFPAGLFWDTAEPYHYLRRVRTHDGELLLIGGEDHKSGQESSPDERYAQLEAFARERLDVVELVARWSSQLYVPADGVPYCGRAPRSERTYIATGFAGVGLVGGTASGLLLGDLVAGREHPWAELFDPTRIKPVAAGGRFVAENLDAAVRFIGDRLARPDVESVDEIAPGSGALVEIEGERLAVYRDEMGELHASSPTCTHLGCRVGWNAAESTWDCPCHGGRFTPTGEVLSGPPPARLERKPLAVLKVAERV